MDKLTTAAPQTRKKRKPTKRKHYLKVWQLLLFAGAAFLLTIALSSLFRDYMGAVAGHWMASMTGVVSLSIAFYENVKGKLDERLFYLVAVFFFFYAGFQAWQDEHIHVAALEGTVLEGTMEQWVPAVSAAGLGEAYLQLQIKNVGTAPTIADKYLVFVDCGNGRQKAFPFTSPDWPHAMPGEPTGLPSGVDPGVLFKIGAIYENTAKPISPGSMERGWLPVEIPGSHSGEPFFGPGCKWSISFVDIHEHRYSINYTMSGNEAHHPQYYPSTH